MNSKSTDAHSRRLYSKSPSLATSKERLSRTAEDSQRHLDGDGTTGEEHIRSHTRESLSSRGPVDKEASLPTKRSLEAEPGHDLPPVKKARLSPPRRDFAPIEEGEPEILQQPKPSRPNSSLEELSASLRHPDPLDTAVSRWLQTIGSDRERFCRSDSYLDRLRDDPISRQRTRSAPEMDQTKDADGFVVPPTPSSTRSRPLSRAGSARGSARGSEATSRTNRSSARISVEDSDYRDILIANNIHMRPRREPLPEHVNNLVGDIRKDRDSPGPSAEEIVNDSRLEELFQGAAESRVEEYFKKRIFPEPDASDILEWSIHMQLSRNVVPFPDVAIVPKFSTPTPDLLYGYNRTDAFPEPHHQSHLIATGRDVRATNEYNTLVFPFFVIEFKGISGNMWVAGNQCLGGAAACVSIAEGLNRQLAEYESEEVYPIDSAAFSIAMNGSEARLYVSWKHDELRYYMKDVESYLLCRPDDYIEFRKVVRNIIDWGKNDRLKGIKKALDTLLEEARKKSSKEAKSRRKSPDSSVKGKRPRSASPQVSGSGPEWIGEA